MNIISTPYQIIEVHIYVIIYLLRDPNTRHLYYLQLRSDVLNDRLQCTSNEANTLASLALQAEWGDSDHPALMNHGYFQPEHYISVRLLRAMGTVYVRESLPDTHKTHRGMSDNEAELKYIKVTMNLI